MVPLGKGDDLNFDAFLKKMDTTDLTILNLYLVGEATVDDKGITMGKESFPWAEGVKNTLKKGQHTVRVSLDGKWDKKKGSKRPTFSVVACKVMDLGEDGYVINKETGAFDVKE